ncbi:MAG: flippase-like domain-containing protein, partial [Lachnospiraceae bacterium]|nr:flippase-like domain-containing protein [Lachnospiraceae bacterium]
CFAAILAVETVKYLIMMRHTGEKVSLRVAFETAALGKYYDYITPSATGGQPFQIWNLHSNGYSDGAAASMPLVSYITKQFSFVALALTVFIFNNDAVDIVGIKIVSYVGCAVYVLVPGTVVASALFPALSLKVASFFINLLAKLHIVKDRDAAIEGARARLLSYSESLKSITKNKSVLIKLLLLSLLMQISLCSLPYFVIHVFGGAVSFIRSLLIFLRSLFSLTSLP